MPNLEVEVRKSLTQTFTDDSESLDLDTYYEEYQQRAFRRGNIAEVFHENTKLTKKRALKIGRTFEQLSSPEMQYVQANIEPDFPNKPLIDLPEPDTVDTSLEEALRERRSVTEYESTPISKETLATLLALSVGKTSEEVVGTPSLKSKKSLRAYPSAGALYGIETYVAITNSQDFEPGVYYYNHEKHALRELNYVDSEVDGAIDQIFSTDLADESGASAFVLLVGEFWRMMSKYGRRGNSTMPIETSSKRGFTPSR